MYHTDNLIVYVSPLEQFRYFLVHQPAVLSIVLTYALACMLLFCLTRGKGFLVTMVSSVCYLVPMIMHAAA